MFFIILTSDKLDSAQVRGDNRPEHLDYLNSFGDKLIAAGDPFAKVGLFASTEIRRCRKAIFNPPAD